MTIKGSSCTEARGTNPPLLLRLRNLEATGLVAGSGNPGRVGEHIFKKEEENLVAMNEERKRDDEDEISITDASLDENEADVRSDKKHSFLWLRGVFNGIKQSLLLAALILVPAMVINMCSVNTEVVQVSLVSLTISIIIIVGGLVGFIWIENLYNEYYNKRFYKLHVLTLLFSLSLSLALGRQALQLESLLTLQY